jgi:hypothetical protein
MDMPLDKAGLFQLVKVLDDRCPGQGQLIRQITGKTAVRFSQKMKDRKPCRMSEGLEQDGMLAELFLKQFSFRCWHIPLFLILA